jgi:ATP-dependent Lon protease
MTTQDELNAKLKFHFKNGIVNKNLAQRQEIIRLPRFVSEFLLTDLSEYEDDKEKFNQEFKRVVELINDYYPEPKDKDRILHKLLEEHNHVIIDEFKVEVDIKKSIKKCHIPSLNIRDAMILDSIVNEHKNLLSTGIWGISKISYAEPIVDESGKKLTSPILIEQFNPFQASSIDLKDFIGKRREFTTEEWMDILVNTIGLNPEVFNERQKLIMVSRFVPLVEPNVNLMEFGPRASGKTYFYRNISFYTRIISGGLVSPAVLFYNIATKTIGEIGIKDSIVFDEVSKIKFGNADEMMGKLKDYMESSHFERGPKKATSLCSLVFMGNIDVKGYFPIEDFTYVLPEFMRDSAFIDRINGLVPGWELPKIKKPDVHLSKNYGFSVDYFSEILHEFRKLDFQSELKSKINLENVTIRDYKSIFKTVSGMAKILHPDKKFDKEDLRNILDICVSYRQLIADWLHKLAPGEFERKKIEYTIS